MFTQFISNHFAEKYDEVELYKTFGNSKDFVTSAARTLRSFADDPNCLSNSIEATNEVATADYEHNSCWGSKVCVQIIPLFIAYSLIPSLVDIVFFGWLKPTINKY